MSCKTTDIKPERSRYLEWTIRLFTDWKGENIPHPTATNPIQLVLLIQGFSTTKFRQNIMKYMNASPTEIQINTQKAPEGPSINTWLAAFSGKTEMSKRYGSVCCEPGYHKSFTVLGRNCCFSACNDSILLCTRTWSRSISADKKSTLSSPNKPMKTVGPSFEDEATVNSENWSFFPTNVGPIETKIGRTIIRPIVMSDRNERMSWIGVGIYMSKDGAIFEVAQRRREGENKTRAERRQHAVV